MNIFKADGRKVTRRHDNKGFSLIELIIVIAIMAVLASVITPTLINYIERAKKVKVLNEARMIYDQCTIAVGEFDQVDFNGKTLILKDGLVKTDPVYGKCGRISNLSCYNEAGAKSLTKVKHSYSYIDQYMAKSIVDTIPAFSRNDYGSQSPNGMSMAQINTKPEYQGKFCFICCYNEDGCLYVEVYHKGYFVHFDGNQKVDDVVNAGKHPEVSFSDVR